MQWLRLYHDTPNDPKFRLVARKSGQPVGNVLAVWTCMMVHASESEERGTLVGWDDEIAAAVLEYPTEAVTAIREAMQGRVLDGDRLTGWEKRQRASDDVAERVKKHRKTKENPPEGGNSGPNGGQTTSPDPKPNGSYSNAGVTLHPVTDSLPPLRAQTPESKKESNADALGAGTPQGSGILPFPVGDKAKLFGPVLDTLQAAIPDKPRRDIQAMLAKALHRLGAEAALDLAARASVKDEPWSWLCKAVNQEHEPAQRRGVALDSGHARILRRRREEQAKADRLFGDPS